MVKYRLIIEYHQKGNNNTQVATLCSCSRMTVWKVINRLNEADISAEELLELSDEKINSILFPERKKQSDGYLIPDYKWEDYQMRKRGVSIRLCWRRYTALAENIPDNELKDYATDVVWGINFDAFTVCGDSYTQDLGSQYEQVSSYIEYLFKQYQPYMWWVLLACAGVWSIAMGVFFAIATKNEDKEKARKMIKNYVIGLVVIFAILVACPYLVKGIAALISG